MLLLLHSASRRWIQRMRRTRHQPKEWWNGHPPPAFRSAPEDILLLLGSVSPSELIFSLLFLLLGNVLNFELLIESAMLGKGIYSYPAQVFLLYSNLPSGLPHLHLNALWLAPCQWVLLHLVVTFHSSSSSSCICSYALTPYGNLVLAATVVSI